MKLLTIHITQECNFSCEYCTLKEHIFKPGTKVQHDFEKDGEPRFPLNLITNQQLLLWLDKFIDPEEWHIELTGGEPGLYKGIDILLRNLSDRGYTGIVRTNGTQPIPKVKGFARCACWHKGRDMPAFYDVIIIIQNEFDNWQEKRRICEANGIPYGLNYFAPAARGNTSKIRAGHFNSQARETRLTHWMVMYSSGQFAPCTEESPKNSIWTMDAPRPQSLSHCLRCSSVIGTERFLRAWEGILEQEAHIESCQHEKYLLDNAQVMLEEMLKENKIELLKEVA